MARRRSSVASLVEGFGIGYDTVGQVLKDRDLADVAKAKPEESQGFTAEQGDQLRAAAESGQYDIAYDEGKGGYTVTPKADPSQTGVVGKQAVTDFMGERRAGTMTEGQVDRARTMAQAGVLAKHGDVMGASRLRREVQQGERDDARFEREQKTWAKQDEADAKAKEYDTELQKTMGSLRFARITGDHNTAMQKYIEDKKAYDEAKAAGKPVGVAPTAPARGDYTPGDALADRAALLELNAKYGKTDPKAITEFADLMQKVQGEGYVRALKLAHAGAPIEEVAKAFNASGKGQIDPATTKIRTVKGAKGQPDSKVIEYMGPDGRPRTIPVLAELDALDQADKVFTRFYQGRADERAERADGRAGAAEGRAAASAQREREKEKALADAREGIYTENNPGATPAAKTAARLGVIEAAPKAGGIESDYKPDNYGQGGTLTQKDKAGNVVITKIGGDGKPKEPIRLNSPGKSGEKPKPKLANPPSQKDIEATAKKYGITEVEVKRRLGIE